MKKMIEKLIDKMFAMIFGSFNIDLHDLKDEDLVSGVAPLGGALG